MKNAFQSHATLVLLLTMALSARPISVAHISQHASGNTNAQQETKAQDEGVIKLSALLVAFDVLVTDASSRPVTGLSKEDFIVLEDGRQQQIETFLQGKSGARPHSIVLILDYSGSQALFLDKSIEAAKRLVDALSSSDEMAIVTDEPKTLVNFTRDKGRLKSALDSLRKRPRGSSAQFTALYNTLRDMVKTDNSAQPIIIIQSDGDEVVRLKDPASGVPIDQQSKFSLNDLYAAIERSRATIYTLIPGERFIGVPAEELQLRVGRSIYQNYALNQSPDNDRYIKNITPIRVKGQETIVAAAEKSGGWAAYLERPERAGEIYARMLADITNRYTIGYYPLNASKDGKLRQVQIEVRGHPDYVVQGRQSYFAPAR